MSGVDAVIVDDSQARLLTGEAGLTAAARRLREWGPSAIVTRQGW